VTVAGAAGALTVPARPTRIVALDPGAAEIVAALGAADSLVGVPAGVSLPPSAHPLEVVAPSGQIDVAKAVSLRPDLVIASRETDPVDVAQIVQRSKASLYTQPTSTIDDVRRAVIALGFVVGQPVAARKLNAELKAQVAAVKARLANVSPATVFVDNGLFLTIDKQSILADLVTEAHGQNIATDSGLGPFPIEQLRTANPQVYLTTSNSGVTLDSLRRDPETRDLQAVKQGRVVVLPADLVTRAGPNVGQALQRVAAALHPDAFR
jgi:iron complex transport system substrate-binding protein